MINQTDGGNKSKKIRVLFIAENLGGGGAEKVLVNLVNYMDKSEFDVYVRTLFGGGTNRSGLNDDVNYSSKHAPCFRGVSQLIKFIPAKVLYKYFICGEYDVVVAYTNGAATKVAAGSRTEKRLAWMHGNMTGADKPKFPSFFISRKSMQKHLRKFYAVVGVSHVVAESIKAFTGVTENVTVKYNTNDTDKIYALCEEKADLPFKKSDDELLFCSVGSLVNVKGFDRLIKCVKRLKDEGKKLKLFILGDGVLRSQIEKQIDELSLSDTVFLLGFMKNPYCFVKKADVFICSSRSEGFSTAVSEAMILSLPTISTDVSGAKEILGENNEYGLVVENSEDGIYGGMKKLYEDRELRKAYCEMAGERGNMFNAKKVTKSVETLIKLCNKNV